MMGNHCLIISPIPSHPQFQGNSARIYRFGRSLQALGYRVHFLYYALEGLTAQQRRQMSECWDAFYSLPCTLRTNHKTLGDHYAIDDWYDPAIGAVAESLQRRWNYRAVVVNYVWFSAALERLQGGPLRLIDTHDVFGDRHVRATEAGMRPEWFYTSIAEETRGLSRADVVIAIQDDEKAYFESLGLPRVETVGFMTPCRKVPQVVRERPVVGYIGSSNPWNVVAFKELVKALEERPALAKSARFVAAGPICGRVKDNAGPFELLGLVDKVEDFYAQIDIALNPMVGGTGLKIKTVEALSFGCIILSTKDGFIGIPTDEPCHLAESVAEMCDRLEALVSQPHKFPRHRATTARVFHAYQQTAANTMNRLFGLPDRVPQTLAIPR